MPLTFENVLSFPQDARAYFSSQPELYQQFLHVVQKYASGEIEMAEMLSRVAEVFSGHPALIEKFNQLLPPGMNGSATAKYETPDNHASVRSNELHSPDRIVLEKTGGGLADVAKYGTFKEFAFFDKVRRVLGNEETYLNFLRCLTLYTNDLIFGSELVDVVRPFLFKEPELLRELQMMLRCGTKRLEAVPLRARRSTRLPDKAMEIDYASCRKHGISYRALPSSYEQPVCTGRNLPGNELCNEVLNDVWVSFPLWSEDSTVGNSKISQYEEFMYRCEDERFELDIVIDNVASTVLILEAVQSSMNKMNADELSAFRLDASLGGTSSVLQRKSVERIYGDKAADMIEGLMKKPSVAVPMVLRRLRGKLEEWREAQKNYNRIWRDQCDKNHGKWLQSQAASFRQVDSRQMRTKTLLNEADTAAEEASFRTSLSGTRQPEDPVDSTSSSVIYLPSAAATCAVTFLSPDGYAMWSVGSTSMLPAFGEQIAGRTLDLVFPSRSDMRDATSLIIHYLSYLPSGQTDESFRISQFLHDTLPQFIDVPTMSEPVTRHRQGDESYVLLYASSSWYLFTRLYHVFCQRLRDIRRAADARQQESRGTVLESSCSVKYAGSYYAYVLNIVCGMMEGTVDIFAFETELQKALDSSAYMAFTVEKILQNIVRQLQHLLADDLCKELMQLFNQHRADGGAGGCVGTAYRRQVAELTYRRRAIHLLADECCFSLVFYKYGGRVTAELIDTELDTTSDEQLVNQYRMSNYIEQFTDPDASSSEDLTDKPVFLTRNIQDCDAEQMSRLSVVENTHCQFAANSMKMSFVANSFSYLYRHGALLAARKVQDTVMTSKRRKFAAWWASWRSQHISVEQERRGREWLRQTQSTRLSRFRAREKRL